MLKRLFGFDPQTMTVKTEVIAGITTFLTMAYILAVNPGIFSVLADKGMPTDAVFTATTFAAIIGTLVMSLYAKKPFGLAPGMGMSAFFVFTACLGMGYRWQFALTAVFIEGIIFIILTVTSVRELIVNSIPNTLKHAIGAGIGLFLTFIGLSNCGIIVSDTSTFLTLGDLNSNATILSIISLIITGTLVILKVRGGLLLSIIITTAIGIPMGVTHYNGIISSVPSIKPVLLQFEWNQIFTTDMLIIVLTILFIDMFDTIGTVVGVSMKANMVDKDGHIDGIGKTLMADAVATTAGACIGSSATTTFIESAAGIAEGGRSGLTSFVIAACFTLALFFSPLFLAIPNAATGPVLCIVGVMMASPFASIKWDDFSESIPAFLTIFLMPFTFSISNGILIGTISYVVLNGICGIFKKDYRKKINLTLLILAILFVCKFIFI